MSFYTKQTQELFIILLKVIQSDLLFNQRGQEWDQVLSFIIVLWQIRTYCWWASLITAMFMWWWTRWVTFRLTAELLEDFSRSVCEEDSRVFICKHTYKLKYHWSYALKLIMFASGSVIKSNDPCFKGWIPTFLNILWRNDTVAAFDSLNVWKDFSPSERLHTVISLKGSHVTLQRDFHPDICSQWFVSIPQNPPWDVFIRLTGSSLYVMWQIHPLSFLALAFVYRNVFLVRSY